MMFQQMPAVALAFLTWLNAAPTTLADAAAKEALRRSLVAKTTRAFSNDDLPVGAISFDTTPPPVTAPPPDDPDPPMVGQPPVAAVAAAAAAGSATAAAASSTPPAGAARGDEQTWRARMTEARDTLSHNQMLAEAVQTRIHSLSADYVNRDDPAQRAKIASDRQKAMDELGRLQKEIAVNEKAIAKIQDDARRAGVPPGWIR